MLGVTMPEAQQSCHPLLWPYPPKVPANASKASGTCFRGPISPKPTRPDLTQPARIKRHCACAGARAIVWPQ
jgi:hypothetical protein